ncbi:MAG: multiple sugar transport system permease protein [Candidatus Sumerlaeota bacterium]|nr:multiple sugar transport system permease protein [Candidatus Sumerlaeota bacterium]
MAAPRLNPIERLGTHAVLVAGAALFIAPLLWMIATSIKVPREMATQDVDLLPRAPLPSPHSPYIDTRAFDEPERPDGIDEATWEEALPRIDALIESRLNAWSPETPGPAEDVPPLVDRHGIVFRTEMREGLLHLLRVRLGDAARAAGADAIIANAEQLLDEDALRRVFEECYRRFSVGEVRVRTTDLLTYSLGAADEWEVVSGTSASLAARNDGAVSAREVRYEFKGSAEAHVLQRAAARPEFEPAKVDRVFVNYRGDASWARVRFEVVRDGRLWRAETDVPLYERDWIEQELRWPEANADPMERRLYLTLRDVGAAPVDAPFAVRLVLRETTPMRAWADKTARAYRQAFREVPFARYMMTSFSLSILNILLAIFSCTLTGYAFARLQWPGRDLCFVLLLATMMLPPQVTMVPHFIIVKSLGWYNTLLPLWIPAAFGIPFFVFLVRQFFKNIPADLEDAARIDGCGFLRIYWHVMLPLVRPVVATIAIFTFMGTWNNFMGPLIYLSDERLFPLALGLFKFNLQSGGDVTLMMAGSFVMTLPILVLFAFLQRYFIQGITLTGTKG